MPTISMQVFIHNETSATLTRMSDNVPGGKWGARRPPESIAPFSTATMGSQSAGFMTGTEARTTYQIGGYPGNTLYVHWDNPFKGSTGCNTNTDIGHYAFFTVTQGNHGVAHFYLRDAGRVATDFLPSRDAFKFTNSWPDVPYSLPPLRGSILDFKYGTAANGLCGGMCLAAADYFAAGMQIPGTVNPPAGEQDPLFLHLVDRLFDTFSVENVTLLLKLMNPLYPDTDENVLSVLGLAAGRAAVMAHQEWPLVRADIDAGRPALLTLQTVKSLLPWDVGKCHQVLVYAYEAHAHQVTLQVYDPNTPGSETGCDEVSMTFDDGDVAHRNVVRHNINVFEDGSATPRPIYSFFRVGYTPKVPRVATPPRVTAAQVQARHVSLAAADAEVLESVPHRSGTKMFPLPHCEPRQFPFTISLERQRQRVTATAIGFIAPRFEWMISGVLVPDGVNKEIVVETYTNAWLYEVTSLADSWLPLASKETVSVVTNGAQLTLENSLGSSNFAVEVQVRCRESGEIGGRQPADATVEASLEGTPERVDGLDDARLGCIVAFLKEQLRGATRQLPAVAAVADTLLSQLGRPADPLWDPDPVRARLLPRLATLDPLRVQLTNEHLAAATQSPVSRLRIRQSEDIRTIDVHDIGSVAEQAQLAADLSRIGDVLARRNLG
ncbi:hypothetical protein [Leekyejoonella antrihumi]|uniref:Uncharacterized protein n=1 Tax=Leekyejoonella antrihumi TaxID=1660198 RepID=A0A563E128_9MICO|nr:hypothetical protein [Leekyejoonella antrihumi]TWP36095.1 hypothetical protein FGL98_11645 [Leekyejoonella antrihumi]